MKHAEGYVLGIDVGVTNVKAVCIDAMPQPGPYQTFERPTHAVRGDWPTGVAELIKSIEAINGPARGIGIAAPGIAHPDGTHIAWMQGRLAEVQDLNWSEFLKRPMPVLNDAQAALLGEVWIGAARGSSNVMLLTLGTGVGGALMVDGKLLKGFTGRAGHLGHISLNADGELDIVNTPGSLESAIGNCTVSDRSHGRFETTHELVAAFEAGDTEAAHVWLTSIRSLAAAIASLINVVDPEVVVIGGGIAQASYESLREPLARELDRFEWRPFGRGVRIVAAHCGSFAGAVGAAKNALDKIEL